MKAIALILLIGIIALSGCAQYTEKETISDPVIDDNVKEPIMIVEDKDTVQVHYTLYDEAGKILDSSSGKDPLTFTLGAGQVILGFNNGVLGMELGQKKTVKVLPENGYGLKDPSRLIPVPLADLQAQGLDPKVGDVLSANGQPIPVVDRNEDTVTLDYNHPLAGQTLTFFIEVVDIQKAPSVVGEETSVEPVVDEPVVDENATEENSTDDNASEDVEPVADEDENRTVPNDGNQSTE